MRYRRLALAITCPSGLHRRTWFGVLCGVLFLSGQAAWARSGAEQLESAFAVERQRALAKGVEAAVFADQRFQDTFLYSCAQAVVTVALGVGLAAGGPPATLRSAAAR